MNIFPCMDTAHRNIRYSFALAAFADEWANAIENYEGEAEMPSLSGCEILDEVPACDMPREYLEFAEETIRKTEEKNGRGIVALAYLVTGENADEALLSSLLDKFGHYLYMQSVGHGVGLSDEFGENAKRVKVPYVSGPFAVNEGNIESFI